MKKNYLFALIATLMLSGCATLWVTGPSPTISRNFLYEDTIVAIGETKEAKNLVLLGEKKTYLVTSGGDRLAILAKLDPECITIENGNKITLSLTNGGFSARIAVKYSPKVYSEEAYRLLASKGYLVNGYIDRGGVFYTANVNLEGKIFDKSDKDLASHKLSHGRKITVESVTSDASTRPDKFVTVPLAVAFDVVTSPLQLLIFSLPQSSND